MSLRTQLTKPLVIEPAKAEQTHTVIFLHRFAANTTDDELRTKVLSEKTTKNQATLREQFPTVKWVFPYPKLHPEDSALKNKHWSGLDTEDISRLGLAGDSTLPYITQIILQEASLVDGLDKIILGGQGETAEAAHDAMSKLPEFSGSDEPDALKTFIQKWFHPSWSDMSQLKLGGFLGMHTAVGNPTRDERDYALLSRLGRESCKRMADIIAINTPHEFVHGGIKTNKMSWDGSRIDKFAEFLALIGVDRCTNFQRKNKVKKPLTEQEEARQRALQRIESDRQDRKYRDDVERQYLETRAGTVSQSGEIVTYTEREESVRLQQDAKEKEVEERRKHVKDAERQKKEAEEQKKRILKAIEVNRRDRKKRDEIQRQNRLAQSLTAPDPGPSSSLLYPPSVSNPASNYSESWGGENEDDDEAWGSEEDEDLEASLSSEQSGQRKRKASEASSWQPRTRGHMSESQLTALGLKTEDSKEDSAGECRSIKDKDLIDGTC